MLGGKNSKVKQVFRQRRLNETVAKSRFLGIDQPEVGAVSCTLTPLAYSSNNMKYSQEGLTLQSVCVARTCRFLLGNGGDEVFRARSHTLVCA